MNKRYLLFAFFAVALGAGMLFMPGIQHDKEMAPEQLLKVIDDPSRFLSTDLLTDRLVKKDPSLLLIDVRPAQQFKAFAIPGAVNIPLDSLLTSVSLELFRNKEMEKVFYSNSDVMADQAWIIARRIGFQSVFVLQGGVNKWFNEVVRAEEPEITEPIEKMSLYQNRKAVGQYFFGTPKVNAGAVVSPQKTAPVQKKPVEASSGGGC